MGQAGIDNIGRAFNIYFLQSVQLRPFKIDEPSHMINLCDIVHYLIEAKDIVDVALHPVNAIKYSFDVLSVIGKNLFDLFKTFLGPIERPDFLVVLAQLMNQMCP